MKYLHINYFVTFDKYVHQWKSTSNRNSIFAHFVRSVKIAAPFIYVQFDGCSEFGSSHFQDVQLASICPISQRISKSVFTYKAIYIIYVLHLLHCRIKYFVKHSHNMEFLCLCWKNNWCVWCELLLIRRHQSLTNFDTQFYWIDFAIKSIAKHYRFKSNCSNTISDRLREFYSNNNNIISRYDIFPSIKHGIYWLFGSQREH